MPDGPLLDEAYPMLGEPVQSFIGRYLDAPETVLVLQGPPGTGKTRGDAERVASVVEKAFAGGARGASLANVFRALG